MNRYCVVVLGLTLKEFLKNLESAQEKTNLVELRLDYIQGLTMQDVCTIYSKIKVLAIATCRSVAEGGKFDQSEQIRLQILEKIIPMGFDYVDIELATKISYQNLNKKTKIIRSYHNFCKTPSYNFLKKLSNSILKENSNFIPKIACKMLSLRDENILAKLLITKKSDIIILGMGTDSKLFRMYSLRLGNYLTFATLGNSTAIGQPSLQEITNFYDKYTQK